MKSTLAIVLVAILAVSVHSQGWSGLTMNASSGCPTSCAYCNTWGTAANAVCLNASSAYYLPASTTCTACSAGCAQCTSASVCTACNSGYFLATGACTACGTGLSCATCSVVTSCIGCTTTNVATAGVCASTTLKFPTLAGAAGGTALNAGSCTAFDGNNMGICYSTAACATAGQQYLAAGSCAAALATNPSTTGYPAVASCLVWDGTTNSYCLACQNGYFPAASTGGATVSTCTANPTGAAMLTTTGYIPLCAVYSIKAAGNTCTACQAGYLPAATGVACAPCTGVTATSCVQGAAAGWTGYAYSAATSAWVACSGTNAATCTYSGTTQVITSCASGYFLNAAGACASGTLGTNAAIQWSSSYIAACSAGYFVTIGNISACAAYNCSACAASGSSAVCTACLTGFNLTSAGACANSTAAGAKGSIIVSGLAFLSAVLYYFL